MVNELSVHSDYEPTRRMQTGQEKRGICIQIVTQIAWAHFDPDGVTNKIFLQRHFLLRLDSLL